MQLHTTPGREPLGLIYRLPSIVERLVLTRLFPAQQPLEIELGSGDGSFLAAYAAQNPDRNFIGVERLLGRIRKMDRKAKRTGLNNLRGVRIESSYFLKYLLPPHSATAIHVYFPDPWPKRKHQRHRLLNAGFPARSYDALAAGGVVYLRTDDRNYFEQMVAVFEASTWFEPVETPPALALLSTDFEKDFESRRIMTLRAAYRRD